MSFSPPPFSSPVQEHAFHAQSTPHEETQALDVEQWQAAAWFQSLQTQIITAIEALDHEIAPDNPENPTFEYTHWQRKEKEIEGNFGGGCFAVLRNGNVFEKAGVAFSNVKGQFPPEFSREIPGCEHASNFTATGVSLVFHPKNPYVPIVHLNTRFITTPGKRWFGGGTDLTPALPFDDDTLSFHNALKDTCDSYQPTAYTEYKKWCDEYFYLSHRKETRGVGGIFYDYVFTDADNFDEVFAFTKNVGTTFLKAYSDIARRRYKMTYGQDDITAQFQKRAKYTEFNLIYDRGIKFGLNTGGNVDAMFMSLPPMCGWI